MVLSHLLQPGMKRLPFMLWKRSQQNLLKLNNHPSLYSPQHLYNTNVYRYSSARASPKRAVENVREGNEVEGFLVEQIADIPDYQLTAITLRHVATNASYLHLAREDSNNVFSVGFRTTPMDSTGLPHILEHTTLCGSERYPCRDPFFKMLNRSMATFMNAMTGPDYTIYPFATQNPQDYYNLLSVYLDAVFRPQLRELDFMQEGWRLEHENPDDPNSPVIFKGVVFNEMKGAFSESERVFGQHILNYILPSHTYGYVSGGDPLKIPDLTWNDLKNFHSKYYHPSNARFYSYGNFPLVNHLKFINSKYLDNFSKLDPKSEVPPEPRWSDPKRVHVQCRHDPLCPDPKKQSTIAAGYLCNDITNVYETCLMQVVSELLVRGPNSPFYKSLVEPNIGAGFSSVTGYDPQTKDTMFCVGLQGVASSDFDKIAGIIDSTVNGVIKDGFQEKQVEAVMHNIELGLKHQSSDFGLQLALNLSPLLNHDGNVIEALNVGHNVSTLRNNLARDKMYLQKVVEKYLNKNNHKLIISMSPDEKYEKQQENKEAELLRSKLANMTADQKKLIYKQGQELQKEQTKKDNTAILPTLRISDLDRVIEYTELKEDKLMSVPLQVCVQPTNGISYFRGIIGSKDLSCREKSLLPLFCNVVTKMGTKKKDFREFDQQLSLKTGGLSFCSHVAESVSQLHRFEEGVTFSSFALDRNVADMFSLCRELFNEVTLEDVKRFETLVHIQSADVINGIADMGHLYAIGNSASMLSPSCELKETLSGLRHVLLMKELSQLSNMDELLQEIRNISKKLLNTGQLRSALNLSQETQSTILEHTKIFLDRFARQPESDSGDTNYNPEARQTHFVLPLPVNFASKSILAVPYAHTDFAALRVLAKLLSAKYLHPAVREKGGAYGSGALLSNSGILSFFSYRDPNSTATFDVFEGSLDWVEKGAFTDQDIDEAKLGIFQKVDAPIPPSNKGMAFFLNRIKDEQRQQHREALFRVTRDDLLRVARTYLVQQSKYGKTLIGPENKTIASDAKWNSVVQN